MDMDKACRVNAMALCSMEATTCAPSGTRSHDRVEVSDAEDSRVQRQPWRRQRGGQTSSSFWKWGANEGPVRICCRFRSGFRIGPRISDRPIGGAVRIPIHRGSWFAAICNSRSSKCRYWRFLGSISLCLRADDPHAWQIDSLTR